MPGRVPYDAYREFMTPLETAIKCLGQANFTVSPGGSSNPAGEHGWTVNSGDGMDLAGGNFQAEMRYQFVRTDDARSWRVTTTKYRYKLTRNGADLFRIHWHPDGNSDETRPNIHIPIAGAANETVEQHYPTGRLMFEDAVEWVILMGSVPTREDWLDVLKPGRDAHTSHRSWAHDPATGH